jgi:hypothetical protein
VQLLRPQLLVLDDAINVAIASLGTALQFSLIRVPDLYEVSPDTSNAYHLELRLLKEVQSIRAIYEACVTVSSQAVSEAIGEYLKEWLRGRLRLGDGECRQVPDRVLSIGTVSGRSRIWRYGKAEKGRPTLYQYDIEIEVRL